MIDLKNQFAGNGDQTPKPADDGGKTTKPSENATCIAQSPVKEPKDAVRAAQENAMWVVYNAKRSAEAAKDEAEWLKAEILDGNPPRGNVKCNKTDDKTDDMTDEEAEMLFYDAAAAKAVAKGKRANHYRDEKKYTDRRDRIPLHGFLPAPCRRKYLDGIPKGALPKGKQKSVRWYDTDKCCRKRVKLTPKSNRPYQLKCVRTRKGGPCQKPKWEARPGYMLDFPEDGSTETSAD